MKLQETETGKQDIQTIFCDRTSVANELNDYFVGVGPGFARDIISTGTRNEVERKRQHVTETMFLKGTNGKEIIDIVKDLSVSL